MRQPWQNFQDWVAERFKRIHSWTKVVAGSGSGTNKLDVSSPEILYECKETSHGSYRFTREEWMKAKHDAAVEQKTGMYVINIQDVVIVAMDIEDYIAIMEIGNEES